MADVRKRKAPAEMLMLSKPSRGRSKHITPSKIPKRMVVSLSKKPNETEVVDDVGTIINPIDEILLSESTQDKLENEHSLVLDALNMSPPHTPSPLRRSPSPPPLPAMKTVVTKSRVITLASKATTTPVLPEMPTPDKNEQTKTLNVKQYRELLQSKSNDSPNMKQTNLVITARSRSRNKHTHQKKSRSKSASSSATSPSSSESSSSPSPSRSPRRHRSNRKHKKQSHNKRRSYSQSPTHSQKQPEIATVAEALDILLERKEAVNNNNNKKQHYNPPRAQHNHHFSVIEKDYKSQSVVIIAQGLEKAASLALKDEGYVIFHYSKMFETVAVQLTKSKTEELAKVLETMLSPNSLFIKFYYWSREQPAFAKLAICGLTSACKQSIKDLEAVGALYIQSWPRSLFKLPQSFRWKDKPIELIWKKSLSEMPLSIHEAAMPRDGWSKGGVDMLIILLGGTNADVNALVNCGCYVYNEIWHYETAAAAMLKYGNLDESCYHEFAKAIRKQCRQFLQPSHMLVISRFTEWWKTKSRTNKSQQVVLCGLDAVSDAMEIDKLQRMGAFVYARTNSLLACDVERIDCAYKDDAELTIRFKTLFHDSRTHPFTLLV